MKIRGRFIGILAVLGLLVALVPLAPVGAVAGEVVLKGGEKGSFFSDQATYNVVTIQVEDADLSPARVGKARFANLTGGGLDQFNLNEGVVGGEGDVESDEFDGGLNNPVCDHDGDDPDDDGLKPDPNNAGQTIDATDKVRPSTDDERAMPGCDFGDAVFAGDNNNDGVEDQNEAWMWTFTLSQPARDANNDGVVDKEDVTVVVDGAELDPDEADYSMGDAATDLGLGVSTIDLFIEPNVLTDNVIIEYEVTEYKFSANTPIRLAGTEVHFGDDADDDFTAATNQKQIDSVGVGMVMSTSTVPGNSDVVVTFVYHVEDTEEKNVTVTSNTSLATGVDRVLNGVETTPRSSLFMSEIALFEGTDYTKIVNQVTNTANDAVDNDGDDNGVVEIDELDNTGQLGEELFGRVTATATALDFLALSTDKAEDLVNMLLPVTHGDTLTVTYLDENPSGTIVKTAGVDLEAPVVTLVEPSDGIFTDESLVTLSAEVVDSGAGVEQNVINILATGGVSLSDPLRVPIVDGYRVTRVPRSAIGEGPKTWFVTVVDKVGNEPNVDDPDTKDMNEATKGAIAHGTAVSKNPFKFAVDTKGPTLKTGKTGVFLKNAGVTTGEDKGKEAEDTNKREWLRVVFDLGEGTAPLDPDTVEASDFEVDGAEPLDAKVNALPQGDAKKGTAVYLQVGQLDTDARPKVELVGTVRDRAGNGRTDGTLSSISDGLAPVLTVSTSAEIANDEIVLTISSSERLGLNPDVQLTETKPAKNVDLVTPSTLRVSLQTGALTTWTATYENPAGAASKQYVVVDVSDQGGNSDTKGDASTESDLISFQVDDAEPSLTFKSASGTDLDDSKNKPEEGAVWIVGEFDEDEHADDSYLKVTVTALTLTNLDTEEVKADDPTVLFTDEVECVDHDTDPVEDADGNVTNADDMCATHTLAMNLTPGMYNIEMTGVDNVGNVVTEDKDFEVVEAEPFELELKPGQNFISIPGMPLGDAGNINTLLADEAITAISTYDRSRGLQGESPWLRSAKDLETGMFSGDITAIEPGKAYFIVSTASVTIEVQLQGSVEFPPTIAVRQGFNGIGFWAVAGDAYDEDTLQGPSLDSYLDSLGWTVAYTYDPTPGRGWEVLRKGVEDDDGNPVHYVIAGKGYLVYALYDTVLTP